MEAKVVARLTYRLPESETFNEAYAKVREVIDNNDLFIAPTNILTSTSEMGLNLITYKDVEIDKEEILRKFNSIGVEVEFV